MHDFLDRCDLSRLDEEESTQLDSEIPVNEVRQAIKSLKSNKAPGPDGLPAELYHKYNDILTPYLHRMYIQAIDNGVLPLTLTKAVITLIHKKGRDPEEVGSYRPIPLLNLEGKLFSKIPANRLSPLMDKLVHLDVSLILCTPLTDQEKSWPFCRGMQKRLLIRSNGPIYLRF